MVTLAINTASRTTQIALLQDDKILKEKEWVSANDESERLMPEIDKLMKSKKFKYDDIKKIVVVKGPGSFTGLRVGVSTANAISYIQKIPVYGVDTFKFLRAKKTENDVDTVVLFAGRSEIYMQPKKTVKPGIHKTEDAIQLLKEKGIKKVSGELLPDQKKLFKEIKFIESKKSFGQTIIDLDKKDLEKEEIIEPLYIKGPGISAPKPIK